MQDQDVFRKLQKEIEDTLLTALWSDLIDEWDMQGKFKARDSRELMRVKMSKWMFRSFQSVDPQKEIVAIEKAMALGIISKETAASRLGLDYSVERDKIANEAGAGDTAPMTEEPAPAAMSNIRRIK